MSSLRIYKSIVPRLGNLSQQQTYLFNSGFHESSASITTSYLQEYDFEHFEIVSCVVRVRASLAGSHSVAPGKDIG